MKKNRKLKFYGWIIPHNKTLLTMKLIVLLLAINLMQITASVYSQNTSFKVENTKLTLQEAIKAIESQTDYRVAYSATFVDQQTYVEFKQKETSVVSFLESLTKEIGIGYLLLENNVIVLTNSEGKILKQQITIKGRLTDSEGNPLPGVNVVEKGTTNGAVTDLDGNYSIGVTSTNTILSFSYVGYLTDEIEVGQQTTIDVILIEDIQSLEEVVVVGYGTSKKSDLTGSVVSIKPKNINEIPVSSLDQFLQGKASGVQVIQNSAAPGGNVSVRIRGMNSIGNGNEPLYVIDGFPIYPDDNEASETRSNALNPLGFLNPSDIASIEILKDASATAIYGSRASSGVILITTKKGTTKKSQINFESYMGWQTPTKKMDLMDAKQYATFQDIRRVNSGLEPLYTGATEIYPDKSSLGSGTDWQDEVLQTAPVDNYLLSVSGNNDLINYYISGNLYNQEGIIINSDFKRATVRANLDFKLRKNINFTTNLIYGLTSANKGQVEGESIGLGGSTISNALNMDPILSIYDEDGSYNLISPRMQRSWNPVASALESKEVSESGRFLGNFTLNWEIVSGLRLRSSLGIDRVESNSQNYYNRLTQNGFASNSIASRGDLSRSNILNENTLSYSTKIGESQNIELLVGYTNQVEKSYGFGAGGNGYLTDIPQDNDLGAASDPGVPWSWRSKWTLASYLGRINYNLLNRYLITLSGRADGSSKFGDNNKWSFFPSAALAWRISEEPFMENLTAVDNLKLRGSYGETGNSTLPSYSALTAMTTANYVVNNEYAIGFGPGNMPNPDIRWETTKSYNAAIDLALFKSRLRFTGELYYKKTEDLILWVGQPIMTGFTGRDENYGSLENKGMDLSLDLDLTRGDFKWTISSSLSVNRNKVLELVNNEEGRHAGGHFSHDLDLFGGWLQTGLPIGVFYGWKYQGIYLPSDFDSDGRIKDGIPAYDGAAPGYAKYEDIDGNNWIDNADKQLIGNPHPDLIVSLGNNITFKGFDLSLFFNGMFGNDVFNAQRMENGEGSSSANQYKYMLEDAWSPENPDGTRPIVLWNGSPGFDEFENNSYWIEDGSFIRLQNLVFGYTFNNIPYTKNLRIYFSGQNLLTITNYDGFDPEVNNKGRSILNYGLDLNTYPRARTYMLGVSVGF